METKTSQIGGGGNSTISYDENTNEVSFSGRNVVTDSPGVGDILCYDESRKYRFIQLDTFHAGTFPSAWETLGVVAMRKGNQVWIVAKENASKKFMDVYPYIVTGYTLDGQEHSAQLRLHGKPSTSTYYEFKYTASTDSEFVSQLKQFLTDTGETDWSAYIKDGAVYLQYDNYTSAEYLLASITQTTGITLKEKCIIDMPKAPSARRKCGNNGTFVLNVARARLFYKNDNTNTGYNPSSDLSRVPNYPVCYPAFCGTSQYQDDHCLYLRQRYCKDPDHPTLAEWEAYIEDIAPVSPAMIGCFAPKWRGQEVFDSIKDITYSATDGTQKPLYPGANYCTKFFGGKGYMPTQYEFYEMFKDVTLGITGVTNQTADAVNRSLYAIGGNTITASESYWLCSRSNSAGCQAIDITGSSDGLYFFYSRRCISVLLLDLNSNDRKDII